MLRVEYHNAIRCRSYGENSGGDSGRETHYLCCRDVDVILLVELSFELQYLTKLEEIRSF